MKMMIAWKLAVSFVGEFSFFEASAMDLRIFGGFLISYWQIFLSCDFWFGESCDFQAWLFVFWVAFSVWGLNLFAGCDFFGWLPVLNGWVFWVDAFILAF